MLFIEHGAVPRSAVVGFPNTATGRANEERDFTRGLARTCDGRDAPAHCRGTYVARTQTGDGGGTVGRVRSVTKNGGKEQWDGQKKFERVHEWLILRCAE